MARLLELIAKGIEDGALLRAVMALCSVAVIMFHAVQGSDPSPWEAAFLGTVIGWYFGRSGLGNGTGN